LHLLTLYRKPLEEKSLIFVPDTNTWVRVSECVWAPSNLQFPGKTSIAHSYGGLQLFFTLVLDIHSPDLELHIAALKTYGKEEVVDPHVVKELIKSISTLKPSPADLYTLKASKIFFMRNNEKSKVNWYETFVIGDRKEYEDAFESDIVQGNLAILDFSLQDVRTCRPFFDSMDTRSKYLSALVEEQTEVDGGELNTSESLQISWKAEAIMR